MFLIIFRFLPISLGIYAQQIPEIKIDPFNRTTGNLYVFQDAIDLCKETPKQKRLKLKSPKKMQPDDNPVLMIVKLKK